MGLDPNYIGHTLFNTPSFTPDPLQDQMRVLQARQGMAQMQTQQRLRDLASQSDLSTPEGVQAFTSAYGKLDPAGAIGLGQKYAMGQQEAEGAKKNAALADLNIQRTKHLMSSELAQENYGILNGTLQQIQKLPPGDPQRKILAHQAYLATVKNSMDYGNPPPPPGDEGPDPEAWLVNKTAQAAPLAMQIAAQKAAIHGDEALSPVAKAKADMKAGRITPEEYSAILRKETTVQPNMATVMVQQAAANADPSQPLPRNEEMAARAIADGAPMQPVGMRNPRGNAINARAQQLFADANGGDMSGFGTLHGTLSKGRGSFSPGGVNGQTLIALDTAVHHFDALGKTVDALGNGDIRGLNAAGNYLSTQFGDPKVTNFETVKSLAADEFAKVAAGTSTGEQERAKMQQLFSSANSPAQLKQAIEQAKILMAGKVQGLNQQYKTVSGGKPISDRVSPETQKILSGMGVNLGGTSAPPTITNQKDYDALPVGAPYVDAQGNPHKKGGA